MRPATVLAAVTTLLLATPIAKAQDSCVTGYALPIAAPTSAPKVPFAATVKLTFDQKLADGNAIHAELHYHIARDASGKTMNEIPGGCVVGDDGQMHMQFRITVRSRKTMEDWTVNDDRKTATIFRLPDPIKPSEAELAAMHATARPHPPQNIQFQTDKLGSREFQGITTNGTLRTQIIPPGQQGNALALVLTNEMWTSSRYGIMMAIVDDPRRGHTTAEIEEFHQGEPDPSLFTPPKDYIVKEQTAPQPAIIISTSGTTQ
jgi:hypothetical protein